MKMTTMIMMNMMWWTKMDLYRAALVIIRIDSLFKGLLFKTIRLVSDKTH